MSFESIAVQIDYGGSNIAGNIVKINPTGVLVELEKIPYQVGMNVKLNFSLPNLGTFSCEARPIKSYDNHIKRVRIETESGPKIEERRYKLSELHFIDPSEEMRSSIMKHLMDLQVNILKKKGT